MPGDPSLLDASRPWKPAYSSSAFLLITISLILVTHAIAYMAHEYAHAFTAWILGWKSNPLALHYGHPTLLNLLTQHEVDENVNYAPVFAAARAWQAGLIAAAGAAIGNGLLTFPLALWAFRSARQHGSRTWAMSAYWLGVMSIGNFIDYVPIRTFSPREDMATVRLGFHCSPWRVLLVLGLPFAVALGFFLLRFAPRTLRWLLPRSPGRRGILVFLTSALLFCFYGLAGIANSGPISHALSLASVCIAFPLSAILGWWLTCRTPAHRFH